MDDQTEHQADAIGNDMPLAALDLLAGVMARNPTAFGGLHALAVDPAPKARGRGHAGGRRRFATFQFAGAGDQDLVHRLPQPGIAPVMEVAAHRRGRGKVPWQCAPPPTAAADMEDRVHDLTHIGRAWPSARLGRPTWPAK